MNHNPDHLDPLMPWNLSEAAITNIIRFKVIQDAAADVKAVIEEFCVDESPDEPEDNLPNWNLNESEIQNIIRLRKNQENL